MELIEVSRERDIAIIKPQLKRIDASVALSFKEAVLKVVESGEKAIVLDLELVQFMDSSGLGAIVSVLKALGTRGLLAVCNVKGAVLSLFKLTRMDKVFLIAETPSDAVDKLS
ncbi:STAS domain-containing protein [Noviherbaspirillum sp. CPCC 100848]|uniref:Anti-sigma factor antagonist n=1 Tax=Noviherbaspirillum album TaxID=3080276 RepID=A0ABU6JE39_9BURK|nr:STAS domain-containing protein [Noviherbaspirillum sp. CPCC 100848]MEC4721907.1 STAS domain-containing protein [Noviherbaspirillum sp. CPCC 100848]